MKLSSEQFPIVGNAERVGNDCAAGMLRKTTVGLLKLRGFTQAFWEISA
jgi:hypothetical protein